MCFSRSLSCFSLFFVALSSCFPGQEKDCKCRTQSGITSFPNFVSKFSVSLPPAWDWLQKEYSRVISERSDGGVEDRLSFSDCDLCSSSQGTTHRKRDASDEFYPSKCLPGIPTAAAGHAGNESKDFRCSSRHFYFSFSPCLSVYGGKREGMKVSPAADFVIPLQFHWLCSMVALFLSSNLNMGSLFLHSHPWSLRDGKKEQKQPKEKRNVQHIGTCHAYISWPVILTLVLFSGETRGCDMEKVPSPPFNHLLPDCISHQAIIASLLSSSSVAFFVLFPLLSLFVPFLQLPLREGKKIRRWMKGCSTRFRFWLLFFLPFSSSPVLFSLFPSL